MPKNEWSYESPLTMPEIAERIRMFCAEVEATEDDRAAPLHFAVVQRDATSVTISLTGEWNATLIFRARPSTTGALITAIGVDVSPRKWIVGRLFRVDRRTLGALFSDVFTNFFGSERPPLPGTPYAQWPSLLEGQVAGHLAWTPASEVVGVRRALDEQRRFIRQLLVCALAATTLLGASVWWQAYRDSDFVRTEQRLDARVAKILKNHTVVLKFDLAGETRSIELTEPDRHYERGQKVGIRASTANSRVEVPGESTDDEPLVWIVFSTIAALWFGCAALRRARFVRRISTAAQGEPLRPLGEVLATRVPIAKNSDLRSALVRFTDGGVLLVRKCRVRDSIHINALETRPCWAIGPVGDPMALVTSDPNQVFVGACSPTHNPLRRWWWNRRLVKVERQRSVAG
jgi:hypothetical protein